MNVNIDDFKTISMKGRMCYAISCFENALLHLNQNKSDWKNVLIYMWSFTDIEFLDDWNEIMSKILPENLLEFKSFEVHDYEHISKDEFNKLYELYLTLDVNIDKLFTMVFQLGISHAYSSIIDHGQRSFDELIEIIKFMQHNRFPLPEIEQFKKYVIEENKGWGNRFDSKYLSKIINN